MRHETNITMAHWRIAQEFKECNFKLKRNLLNAINFVKAHPLYKDTLHTTLDGRVL